MASKGASHRGCIEIEIEVDIETKVEVEAEIEGAPVSSSPSSLMPSSSP